MAPASHNQPQGLSGGNDSLISSRSTQPSHRFFFRPLDSALAEYLMVLAPKMSARDRLYPALLKPQHPFLMLLEPKEEHFRYRLLGARAPSRAYALELVGRIKRVGDHAAALFSVSLYRNP